MFKFISSQLSLGMERTGDSIKCASAEFSRGSPRLIRLFSSSTETPDVKQFYTGHPVTATALSGKEVLIRPLRLPVTKPKDIDEALVFQAEPLLPYPADQAILTYLTLSKSDESTDLILLAARKEAVVGHIASWEASHIEPEKIACIPSALAEFANAHLNETKCCLVLHLQPTEMTCILLREGRLSASFSLPEGLNLLHEASRQEETSLPQNEEGWVNAAHGNGPLANALRRMEKEIVKLSFSLTKECKSHSIEGIAITGSAVEMEGLSEVLVQNLHLALLSCKTAEGVSSKELLSYAAPIGLAYGAFPARLGSIDFRQQELSYPHPWKRLVAPIGAYFTAILLLSAAFYFFAQQYLNNEEFELKKNYVGLLADMNKSHESFEAAFSAKHPNAEGPIEGALPRIENMSQENLTNRLSYLQKELQSSPDSFPLLPNIPRVSDTLAWLTHHPSVALEGEDGKKQSKIQIEEFSYIMLKRPQQGKKQEKYQVKIELEFTSATPKWAREFHDALIAPNQWIDPKAEVKWNSNRGKYKTSFFLKDKTIYPSP